jgi:hypothetical protein
MGAYFQNGSQVAANYRYPLDLAREPSSDIDADAVEMLAQAVRAGKGPYITF